MKEKWELAYEDFIAGMKKKDIAEKYGVSINTVKSWGQRHWKNLKKDAPYKDRRGAPVGNHNATGPPKNQHARKHGLFSKWLPEDIKEIIGEIPNNPEEILWHNIQLQYAAIIRAQKIMYVNDKYDMTKETTLDGLSTGYEIQQAWDKHANFMSAQSRAMKTLESMIRQYEELIHQDWNSVSDERKARIQLIKAQFSKLQENDNKNENEKVVIINDLPK